MVHKTLWFVQKNVYTCKYLYYMIFCVSILLNMVHRTLHCYVVHGTLTYCATLYTVQYIIMLGTVYYELNRAIWKKTILYTVHNTYKMLCCIYEMGYIVTCYPVHIQHIVCSCCAALQGAEDIMFCYLLNDKFLIT